MERCSINEGKFLFVLSKTSLVWVCAGWVAAGVAGDLGELLYREDFEQGWNGWTNDTTYNIDPRFAWVVGPPTQGPASAHGGTACAGTLAPGIDCYLVSPPLALPAVNQYSNHVWLFYWQWQDYLATLTNSCISDVKVRQYNLSPMGNYWGPWNIIDPGTSGVIPPHSRKWTRRGIDLTLFAGGGVVQLGFGHSGTGNPGWFVDDVEVWNVPVLPDWPGTASFEDGWQGWQTDHGLWDLGVPGPPGPATTPDGRSCAGTALDGVIPTVMDSHLWSPAFYLPALKPGEKAFVRFEQWADYPGPVGMAVHWSQWWSGIGWTWPQLLTVEPLVAFPQRTWTPMAVEITRQAGLPLPMRLGFEHSNVRTNTLGWFVDNVRVEVAGFRLTGVQREGNDLLIRWVAPTETTNVVQYSAFAAGPFTNVSAPLLSTGLVQFAGSGVHRGAATNSAAGFYRLKRFP